MEWLRQVRFYLHPDSVIIAEQDKRIAELEQDLIKLRSRHEATIQALVREQQENERLRRKYKEKEAECYALAMPANVEDRHFRQGMERAAELAYKAWLDDEPPDNAIRAEIKK